MARYSLLVGFGVVALLSVSAGFWLASANSTSTLAQLANANADKHRLQQQVAALKATLRQMEHDYQRRSKQQTAALQQRIQTLQSAVDQANRPGGNTDAFGDVAIVQAALATETGRQPPIERLEQQLLSEAYDARWADDIEQRFSDFFYDRLPDGANALTGLHCQSSLCRIEIEHADTAAEAEFLRALNAAHALQPALDGVYYQRIDADVNADGAPSRSVLFVARRGYPLPSGPAAAAADTVPGPFDVSVTE